MQKSNIIIPELSCYIYISHLDDIEGEDFRFWHLPQFPDTITDTMNSTFEGSNALGRSAPVFTYSNSGPRTVSVTLNLLRDLMDEINATGIFASTEWRDKLMPDNKIHPWTFIEEEKDKSGKIIKPAQAFVGNEDYTDQLIRALQSISVPKYNVSNSAVEPPLVAIKFGREIFIKGVVSGSISVTYTKPILSDEKYNQVQITFSVTEVDPYDATSVFKNGSFRGITNTLRAGMNMEEV